MKTKKVKGFMLLPAVLMSILLGLIGVSFVQIYAGQFNAMSSGRKAIQALQYAQSEADFLRNVDYANVASSAHGRTDIAGASGWQSQVTVGGETTVAGVKQRLATVNVYRNSTAAQPEFSLQVPLSSASSGGDSCPVGTILPYIGAVADIPRKWALCDGSNGTPNLTGRFLQGWGWDDFYWRSIGEYVSEGLPNITGVFGPSAEEDGLTLSGAFYAAGGGPGSNNDKSNVTVGFDAARCSWIYGNSATVQPRSYVVMYIVKIQK